MYSVRPPYLLRKLFPTILWRKNEHENKIYLSFDDGPIPEVTPWVLDILKDFSVTATFFCVGENVKLHSNIYQRILDENHAVGNHTYNHINGWKTKSSEYLQNVAKCAEQVNTKLFRPPYGKIRKKQQRALEHEYTIVMWDVLSGDYDPQTSPEQCLKNVVDKVQNGSIVLFHDSVKAKRNMQYALPRFLEFAKQKGFQFEKL